MDDSGATRLAEVVNSDDNPSMAIQMTSTPGSAARPPALTTLQAGRGLAALLVVLFHTAGMFEAPTYWDQLILAGLFGFGHAGVEFFFVLSGYIMVLAHRADIGNPSRVTNFAIKRAIRIYPMYLLVTVSAYILYLIMNNDRSYLISNSILLIGAHNNALLAVGWTLFHEIIFYLVFAAVILNKRIGIIIFALWFAMCIAWFNRPAPHYSLLSVNLVFGFGMLAAWLPVRIPKPTIVLSFASLIFVMLGLEEVYLGLIGGEARALMYGAVSALGIAAAVCAEKRGQISSPKWLAVLGDSSYSLYLVHYPVLAVVARAWLASPLRELPTPLAFCTLVVVAVLAGIAAHWLVERHLISAFASWKGAGKEDSQRARF